MQNWRNKKGKTEKYKTETRRKKGECSAVLEDLEMEDSSDDEDTDGNYIEDKEEENSDSEFSSISGPQNRNQYPEFCKLIDRGKVSNWAQWSIKKKEV